MPLMGEEQLFWLLKKILNLGFCVLHSIIAPIWNDELCL